MLKNQKNMILFMTGYLIVSVLVGLILVLSFNRNDLFPITMIISTLILLLIINFRSSHFSKIKYKKAYNKEKLSDEEIKKHKTGTMLLLLLLLVMAIVSLITGFTVK